MLDNKSYYDQFAKNYETRRHHGYHLLLDDIESSLVNEHARGRETLEVGCGTGLILERVAKVADRAVGVDLSPGMLEQAKQKGLEVQQADATALPFDDDRFDLTYSFKVLAHVRDIAKALHEMARVTKPGGRLFYEFYNRHSLRYLARRARGGHEVAAGIDDNQVYVRFDTRDEIDAWLPKDVRCVRMHGVRIFTPLPAAVSWPLVGHLLATCERRFVSSRLARFGGFLILECEKTGG